MSAVPARDPSNSNPATLYARERRAKLREAKIAAGWKDGRYGIRPGTKTQADRTKSWRNAHHDVSRTLDRIYRGMHRNDIYRNNWPLILAHYGGRCLNPNCRGRSQRICSDHVIPVLWGERHNCLLNLQPLCQACNSTKQGQRTDFRPDGGAWIGSTFGAVASVQLHPTARIIGVSFRTRKAGVFAKPEDCPLT